MRCLLGKTGDGWCACKAACSWVLTPSLSHGDQVRSLNLEAAPHRGVHYPLPETAHFSLPRPRSIAEKSSFMSLKHIATALLGFPIWRAAVHTHHCKRSF